MSTADYGIEGLEFVEWHEGVTDTLKELIYEYQADIDIDLNDVQDFDTEMATLPGKYVPEKGGLFLLVKIAGVDEFVGIVGYKVLGDEADKNCEMKRMYVRPSGRGKGLGKVMAIEILRRAKAAGYERIYLDTLPHLEAAIALYRRLGFDEVDAYYGNSWDTALFFCYDMTKELPSGCGYGAQLCRAVNGGSSTT